MWPTLATMMRTWRGSESYQYAWLVVPMVVYLLGWHHRQSGGAAVDPRPGLHRRGRGDAAAACWGAATLMNVDVGRQLALVLALQGVAMSALGWRSYWRLFPTLALLFLMIPSAICCSRRCACSPSRRSSCSPPSADLPHRVDGFVIFIGTHRYIVVDECSGLAYVHAGDVPRLLLRLAAVSVVREDRGAGAVRRRCSACFATWCASMRSC